MKSKYSFQFTILAILFISLVGCAQKDSQQNDKLYWESSTPAAEGIDPLVLDSIHQDIVEGKYGLIDQFMVIRHGKVVFNNQYEQDYKTVAANYDTTNFIYNYDHPAWHPYYNYTELHSLQSVTKSVTSALLGIAMDEKLIPDVNMEVMPLFKDYKFDLSDPRKQAITLEDLLTMRGGIAWDENSYDSPENDCIRMELSDDWIQYVLDKPMDTISGVKFVYNSGISVLLGKIVGMATGKRIDKWAEEKLFKPLGISNYYWKETPKGEIDTEGGLYLSSEDLAKIGYLFLNEGVWEDQQIISKEWVRKSTLPTVKLNDQVHYGYQWWVPEQQEGVTEIFAGNGYGGQFVMMVPKYDMVVVFNGWSIHDRAEKSSWRALQDRILPNTTL